MWQVLGIKVKGSLPSLEQCATKLCMRFFLSLSCQCPSMWLWSIRLKMSTWLVSVLSRTLLSQLKLYSRLSEKSSGKNRERSYPRNRYEHLPPAGTLIFRQSSDGTAWALIFLIVWVHTKLASLLLSVTNIQPRVRSTDRTSMWLLPQPTQALTLAQPTGLILRQLAAVCAKSMYSQKGESLTSGFFSDLTRQRTGWLYFSFYSDSLQGSVTIRPLSMLVLVTSQERPSLGYSRLITSWGPQLASEDYSVLLFIILLNRLERTGLGQSMLGCSKSGTKWCSFSGPWLILARKDLSMGLLCRRGVVPLVQQVSCMALGVNRQWMSQRSTIQLSQVNINSIFFMLCRLIRQIHLPTFKDLRLNTWLLDYLNQAGLHTPTAIQALAIPPLIHDQYFNFQLTAQTGTGKTLAFMLTLYHNLKSIEMSMQRPLTTPKQPSALVIGSSRELVKQTKDVGSAISHFCRLKISSLGVNGNKRDKEQLDSGVDIVVSTLQAYEKACFRNLLQGTGLKLLIIDEIDTLLDAGGEQSLRKLIQAMKGRQIRAIQGQNQFIPRIALVSSTYTKRVDDFIRKEFNYRHKNKELVKNFAVKRLLQRNAHLNLEHIKHQFVHCKQLDKQEPLLKVLAQVQGAAILFCNSVASVQSLDFFLAGRGFKAVALHGDIPKRIRQANMARFRSGGVQYLLSTDLGSRGLDFPFVDTVINFDFPKSTSDYLHRAGRTGRAGKPGICISLYHKRSLPLIDELKKSYDSKTPLDVQGSAYALSRDKPAKQVRVVDSRLLKKRQLLKRSATARKQAIKRAKNRKE